MTNREWNMPLRPQMNKPWTVEVATLGFKQEYVWANKIDRLKFNTDGPTRLITVIYSQRKTNFGKTCHDCTDGAMRNIFQEAVCRKCVCCNTRLVKRLICYIWKGYNRDWDWCQCCLKGRVIKEVASKSTARTSKFKSNRQYNVHSQCSFASYSQNLLTQDKYSFRRRNETGN